EDELVQLRNMSDEAVKHRDFPTLDDGHAWYKRCAFARGFGIQTDKFHRSTKGDKSIIHQKYVCNRQGNRRPYKGERKTKARSDTRCGCEAHIRFRKRKVDGKWFVHMFSSEHTHVEVVENQVHLIRSHRMIEDAARAELQYMTDSGMKTHGAYKLIVHKAGGHEKVGFTSKDAYNQLHKEHQALIIDGDASSALTYLRTKERNDDQFFLAYTTDDEERVENIFWADGMRRSDYACFDATYRKNAYNMPLVVFSGVNHHFSTCLFGSALLKNEKTDNYKWVLETLMEAMDGKTPKSVITDGDTAMKNVIMDVFPNANRRRCLWHLKKKIWGPCKVVKICIHVN
ncbi:Protein FAR1-RELATED SEQUENCE 5, partial [Linum grandiflorum]